MTEEEWLACEDLDRMLTYLWEYKYRWSNRKGRLFAAACCRRIWRLLTDERARNAVEVAERHADGAATEDDLRSACTEAVSALHNYEHPIQTKAASFAADVSVGDCFDYARDSEAAQL